jgi:toxin ParE1/3/4
MTAGSMAQAALSYLCWLRPEYRDGLDVIEAWIAQDNASAAVAMWLLIDDQVEQLADPNCPRRPSTRVAGVYELVAHEKYVVYFDQDESTCTITVLAAAHVARQFP